MKEWYPPKLPAKERLPWYAQHFDMVELNSSFYAIPDRSTAHSWVEVTPPGFTFDVKAHRYYAREQRSFGVRMDQAPERATFPMIDNAADLEALEQRGTVTVSASDPVMLGQSRTANMPVTPSPIPRVCYPTRSPVSHLRACRHVHAPAPPAGG